MSRVRMRPGAMALALAATLGILLATAGPQTGLAASGSGLLNALPSTLRQLYQNTTDPILPSAYDHFAAVKTPWSLCYADSYEGNPWRLVVRKYLQYLTDQFHKAGKVASLQVTVSNGSVPTQISQIRSFIDKKCSVILSIPESSTGINAAVKAAYDAGIPFIAFAGAVTSPYAINVDSNYYLWGYDMARGIARALGGKGNVVMVEGIAGQPVAVAENAGGLAAFKAYPNIKIIAQVNGNWTPSVTKSVVLQVLATHPQRIDAVWTTGSELREVAQAFEQAGKPVPLVTASASGDGLGYLHQQKNNGKFYGGAVLPSWTAQTAFRVAVRMLQGQHPRLDTLMVPIPTVSSATLGQWYKSCMTPSTSSIFPVAPTDPLPESLLNAYFTNGAATPPYTYANQPSVCSQ